MGLQRVGYNLVTEQQQQMQKKQMIYNGEYRLLDFFSSGNIQDER